MNKELEEMQAAKEELEALREEVNTSIDELKQTAKESAVSIVTRSVVAVCVYSVVDKLANMFLPNNLKGIAKLGAVAGTFVIPELVGNVAATKVENILQEDN